MCDELLLAIDTGGSKSDFLLLAPEKHYLKRSRSKGVAALNPGTLPVEQYLRDGINELGPLTNRIKLVFCSLGGPNVDEVTSALKTLLPDVEIRVKREADGDMVLSAASAYHSPDATSRKRPVNAVSGSPSRRWRIVTIMPRESVPYGANSEDETPFMIPFFRTYSTGSQNGSVFATSAYGDGEAR